jgi:clan AA aspartic protease
MNTDGHGYVGASDMNVVYADIELSNPQEADLKPLAVKAFVDMRVVTLCIPEHVMVQLRVPEIEKREVRTADERAHEVPYVGPVQVRFQGRTCFTGALVLGDSVLMGAVPMEDMDLVVCPREQTVTVNPESPNMPSAIVK